MKSYNMVLLSLQRKSYYGLLSPFNICPQLGFERQTLDPVASTLTTRSPRATTFVPKWVEVTAAWTKLHNKKLHNLHSSRNITGIRIIESRMMEHKWHVNVVKTLEMHNFNQRN
jgi:hypothetical protein